MKKYSKTNGYWKYYNKEGKWCRIKFKKEVKNSTIMIKFKKCSNNLEPWMYYAPYHTFKNKFDVINYITKNLEKNGLCFQII